MKNIYLILIWIIINTGLTAQNLPMAGVIYTPDQSGIQIRGMTCAFDSSYVLLCQSTEQMLVLIKIDEYFNIIWSKKYDFGIEMEHFLKIISTSDSALVLTGTNVTGNTCIVKLTADGDIIWSKKLTSYDAVKTNIIETADHNLLVSCHGEDVAQTATSTSIVKLTPQGSFLWGKKISGNLRFTADAVANTSDNRTIIGGNQTTANTISPLIISLDENGDLEWSRQLISEHQDTKIFSMTLKAADFVFMTNYGVICTSPYGDLLWAWDQLEIEYLSELILPPVIMSLPDGSLFYPYFCDYWPVYGLVTKLSPSGDPVFRREVQMKVVGLAEGFHNDQLIYGNGPSAGWPDNLGSHIGIYRFDSLGQTPSCVVSVGANSDSSTMTIQSQGIIIDDYMPFVIDMTAIPEDVQLNMTEQCVEVLGIPELAFQTKLEIIPNPMETRSLIVINGSAKDICTLKIFGMDGKILFSDSYSGNKYILNKGSLTRGLYLLQITDKNGEQLSGKLMIE